MDGCRRITDSNQICGNPAIGISGLCRIHKNTTCKWSEDGDYCGEARKGNNEYCKYHLAQKLDIQMGIGEWDEFLEWVYSLSKKDTEKCSGFGGKAIQKTLRIQVLQELSSQLNHRALLAPLHIHGNHGRLK